VYNPPKFQHIHDQEFTISSPSRPSLSKIEPFVQTAERLSFRAAASHLGITPTAVSKAVAALEAELGVKLLNRTSRHVALTPEGEVYLGHCREALDRLQAGLDEVTRAAQVAEGPVRVSLSPSLGREVLQQLCRLVGRYPRIEVHLSFDDQPVALVEAGVDVAVRIGPLPDSSLVARRLRSPRWATVAAPSYLARHGPIRGHRDLADHACVRFATPSGTLAPWWFQLAPDAAPVAIDPPARLVLDHGELLLDAALAGLGVAQVFDGMAAAPVRRGELVEVLAHEAAPGPPLHALTLPGRQKVPKIRAFLDFLQDVF
jgi:LysR family transcriptional regulator, regulator for bpeEF and oprC